MKVTNYMTEKDIKQQLEELLHKLYTRTFAARNEANTHFDRDRIMYCEGTAHGIQSVIDSIKEILNSESK